jgi:LytS/YehU family sensor histidine kinase
VYLGLSLLGAALFAIGVVIWLVAGHFRTARGRDRAHATAISVAVFGLIAAVIGVIAALVSLSP